MIEKQAACPGCDRSDEVMTVRAAYEDRAGALGGPPWQQVAPPPAPGPPPRTQPGGGVLAGLVIGALLAFIALMSIAENGLPAFGNAYQLGHAFGRLVLPVVLLGIFGARYAVGKNRYREQSAAFQAVTERFRQRTAVWEAAQLCRRCRSAFFADGVLRADFPASPPIAVEQFPLMVATMAERVLHGTAVRQPVPTG
ncbi:hypothetical protein [Kitasatospora sp. NPDC050543]|uniref:hypothetical protein n=1 Tax=Kitasatospora sp. NPDC050543 TaxID=3364054 RepID=UPI0037B0534B